MKLKDYYQKCVETIQNWHNNHTDFGAFVECRMCYWLPNELLENENTATLLGWTLEEIQDDSETYYQEYMEWFMKNSLSTNGFVAHDVVKNTNRSTPSRQHHRIHKLQITHNVLLCQAFP